MATRRDREQQEKRKNMAKEWAKKPSLSAGEGTCIRLPEGVQFFKLDKLGIVKVDFMPYIAGKLNRRADEGEPYFELEYEAHRVPTGDGTRYYLCTEKMGLGRCAVCDWLKRNGATADPELLKTLRTTTRHLWCVNPDPGNTKATLKVFDSNHYNKKRGFGEQMAAVINTLDEDEDPFALVGGSTAVLTVGEDSFPGGKYNLVERIDLKPRKYEYPEAMLKNAPCLDQCLVVPEYDEVAKLLETGESSKPTKNGHEPERKADDKPASRKPKEDDKPKKRKGPNAEDMELNVGDVVTHERYGECEITEISDDGYEITIEDNRRKAHLVEPDDVTLVPVKGKEKPREEPTRKKTKSEPVELPLDDDDDPADDDDDLDDDDGDDPEDFDTEQPEEKPRSRSRNR